MEKPILSIAIPTYNRREKLVRLVTSLRPMLTSQVYLLVVDNDSDYPVHDALQEVTKNIPASLFTIVKNKTNVGANPNVLRCFELVTTEWVWIIGDDDLLYPEAIETVIKAIKQFPDALVVNFNTQMLELHKVRREQTTIVSSIESLADSLDDYANFLFISANVYRRKAILPWLRLGYMQIHSFSSHVSMVLAAIQEKAGICVFHSGLTIRHEPTAPGDGWNWMNVARALPEAFNVIGDPKIRSTLAKKSSIYHWAMYLPSLRTTAIQIATASSCESKLAFFAADYLERARGNILYSSDSVMRVVRKLLIFCAMLICNSLLFHCRHFSCWIKRKSPAVDQQPLGNQITEALRDKRL